MVQQWHPVSGQHSPDRRAWNTEVVADAVYLVNRSDKIRRSRRLESRDGEE
jgi:hypothetical protein